MLDEIEIVELLHAERDAIDTSDPDRALTGVRRRVATRRRRRRGGAVLSAAALVAAGGVGLAGLSDNPSTIVTETPTTQAADPAPTASTPPTVAPAPTTSLALSPTSVPITAAPEVSAVLGDAIAGARVPADLSPATDALTAASGQEIVAGYQLPWGEGFIVGWSSGGPNSSPGFVTSDGATWTRVDLAVPIGNLAASTGSRLATLVTDWATRDLLLRTTSDLDAWNEIDLPAQRWTDLPVGFRSDVFAHMLAANDAGWIVATETFVSLDAIELVAERLDLVVTDFMGAAADFGNDQLHVELEPKDPDAEAIEVSIPWADLEAEFGNDLIDRVRRSADVEVWTGGWDGGDPVRHDLPTELDSGWRREVVATRDAFVVLTRADAIDDDGPLTEVELVAAAAESDELDWTILDIPIDGTILAVFPLGDDLGVISRDANAVPSVHRVDVVTQTWSPVTVPGLPGRVRGVDQFGTGAVLFDAAPPIELGPVAGAVEQDGLRYEWSFDSPISSYQVVERETGDVLVEEAIDVRDVTGDFETAFEHLVGGIGSTTIRDPNTGEVLMEITAEAIAESTVQPEVAPPERWVLASDDGVRWLVEPMPVTEGDGTGTFVVPHVVQSEDQVFITTDRNDRFIAQL